MLIAAAIAILISIGYPEETGINRGEFYALILFSTLGMMLMGASRDLMLLFLALELMSVAVYVLVGFNRSDPRSAEGSLKYFLLGAFSSAFLLYGIALVWGSSGTTNLGEIAPRSAEIELTLKSGQELAVDHVLVCAGRTSNATALCPEAAGFGLTTRGLVPVDEHFRTTVPHIYAVGDVIGFPALASTSSEQGRVAACHAFGSNAKEALAQFNAAGNDTALLDRAAATANLASESFANPGIQRQEREPQRSVALPPVESTKVESEVISKPPESQPAARKDDPDMARRRRELEAAYRAFARGELDIAEQLLDATLLTWRSGEAYLLRGCT
jgi:hypothetical protein